MRFRKPSEIALNFLFVVLFTGITWAMPPEEYEIPGIHIDSIRLSTNENIKFDYDTDKVFHPYFTESINAILAFYKSKYRLPKIMQGRQEPTAGRYLDSLKAQKIKIGKMAKLQGRVLRVLISSNIPVLLIGNYHNPKRKVYRVHADLIYMYREPDFIQSTKKLPEDIRYAFKTARGWTLLGEEIREPARIHNTGRDDSEPPGNELAAFEYFCIIVSPEMSLKRIKKLLNDGLSDSGFEYKLPEFSLVKAAHVTW